MMRAMTRNSSDGEMPHRKEAMPNPIRAVEKTRTVPKREAGKRDGFFIGGIGGGDGAGHGAQLSKIGFGSRN
jgi:hypothetical protein